MKKLPSAKAFKSKRNHISDDGATMKLDAAWFKAAKIKLPAPQQSISLRLDSEVLVWYGSQKRSCQTRMQAVLTAYVKFHTKHSKA